MSMRHEMMKKRALFAVLALSLCAGTATCGGKKDKGAPAPVPAENVPAPVPVVEEVPEAEDSGAEPPAPAVSVDKNAILYNHDAPDGEPVAFTGGIRGEVIMTHEVHKKYFADKANCRNAANGLMKRKDSAGSEYLQLIAYDVWATEGEQPFRTRGLIPMDCPLEPHFQLLSGTAVRQADQRNLPAQGGSSHDFEGHVRVLAGPVFEPGHDPSMVRHPFGKGEDGRIIGFLRIRKEGPYQGILAINGGDEIGRAHV